MPPSTKNSSSFREFDRNFRWRTPASKSIRYVAAKRMVKICTAENPWLISTLVLTKLVPQKMMVQMARMCHIAMDPEDVLMLIFTGSNIENRGLGLKKYYIGFCMLLRAFIIYLLLIAACCFGDAPKDMPLNVNKSDLDIFVPYAEMARRTFPEVKKKFVTGVYQKEGRQLFVQVLITDNQGGRELTFVRVLNCQGDSFKGSIANQLFSVKGYAMGDLLTFKQEDVRNWVVVDARGNEEGNYVGKAVDAYQYVNVGLFFQLVYSKGRFDIKYLYSMVGDDINVDGILPAEVIEQAKNNLKSEYVKKLEEGTVFEEGVPFYSYWVYDFVNKKLLVK